MQNIRIQFGSRVKELRQKLNMSQEEFAFRAGLDRTYITRLENRGPNISLTNIEKIAEALEISIPDLFKF